MRQVFYLKVQLRIFLFFNKKEIFKISKYNLVDNVYNYWIKRENDQNIDKRFVREELFALENNLY